MARFLHYPTIPGVPGASCLYGLNVAWGARSECYKCRATNMNSQQNLWRLVLLLTLVSAVGCRPATPVATAPPEETTPGTSDGVPRVESTINKRLAIQAKDALAERLTARLTDAMTTAGPAAAVQVCSEVAQQLANEVGTEFRVRIGRTSFKLRNPKNVPPAWAAELVEQRDGRTSR